MYKRRRLNRPKNSLNAEEAISLMQTCNDKFKMHHSFSINGPLQGEMAIGFMSPKWICALQSGGDATLLQADARVVDKKVTIYCNPPPPPQNPKLGAYAFGICYL